MHHTNVPLLNTILDYLDTLPQPIGNIIQLLPALLFIYFVIYISHIRPSRKEKQLKEHKNTYENDNYKYLDANAKIVDIKTEKYYFTKLYKGFKTIVTFSDGFKYLSTDANYTMHLTYSTISVGQMEKLEIATKAIAAHKKAYEKLYGVVLESSPLRLNKGGTSSSIMPQNIATVDEKVDEKLSATDEGADIKQENSISLEAAFCRKCGSKMPADSVFCPKCGEKVISFHH